MILTVLLAAAVTAGAALPERALPDNPCEIIDATEIAIAGQLVVQPGRRVPSIGQEVEAQKAGRPPAPGRICSFDTGVEFGAISLSVLPRADRRQAAYRESRERYFRTFAGSARHIAGLGEDAWLAGGASLHVLIRADEFFTLSTQQYQPESGELLTKIANLIVAKY
jgi:hypothetical protein